ncbi:MAG: tetratricopeptide repeat protein [Alphaproteobacteria bacterium]|nr:tetratricopeptide repeat protein [Alphaproteobacteria bacterium]
MSQNARQHFSTGSKLFTAGQLDEAARAFEQALAIDPTLTAAAFQLARVREAQGAWTRAVEAYDRLLEHEPTHQTALANRGECLRQAGCYPLALEDYTRALEVQPDHLFALAGRAETLRMLGRSHEALAWFDSALGVNPEHVFALRGKAATLNALARYEEALPYWTEAIALDPESSFSIQGRDEARRAMEAGDRGSPPDDTPPMVGAALLARNRYDWGRALASERRWPAAIEAFQQALEVRSTWVDCALELAIAHEESQAWEDALRAYDRVLEMEPTRVEAASNQGDVLRKEERYEEAIGAYDRALQLKPDHVEALAGRGEALRHLSRFDAALTWFSRAVEQRPQYAFALRGKAAALNALGRHEEALPLWERALGVDPASAFSSVGLEKTREALADDEPARLVPWNGHQLPDRATLSRAQGLIRQARHAEAIQLLEEATRTDPTWVEPLYLLGVARVEMRDYTGAIDALETALALEPEHLEAALARANAMRKNSDYRSAIEAYDAILELQPDEIRALTQRGECSRMLGDFTAALRWFERALAVRPNHNFALCGKAACLNALGRFREAEPIWVAALQDNSRSPFIRRGLASCRAALGRPEAGSLMPAQQTGMVRGPGVRSRAQQAVEQGRSHYKAGEYQQAIHAFRRALSIDPAFNEAALRLGMAYEDDRQYDAAIEAYERCIAIDDQHYQAATNIGEAMRKNGRYAEAIDAYDRALRIQPTYLYALAGRAECMRMEKDNEGALEWFDKALAENDQHAFAIQGKAAALNTLGRFDEAQPLWERALAIEPTSKFAQDGLAKCQANLTEPKLDEEPSVLQEQGRDLTELARAGRLAPVIGRKSEIRSVMKTLVRRLKANPLLLGDPGVGKTAVVEGVAQRLVGPGAPERLKNLRIIELSMGGLVAGTKYRGTFEERLKSIVKECRDNPEIVLFIDEIHTLVGAGRTEGGSLDAANILKPALARGEITIIGATTVEEYTRSFETDSALDRRFQPIRIEEPSEDEAVELLTALASAYEKHHEVKIDRAALSACVRLAVRFIPDRRLPDKALDVLDEACAEASLGGLALVTRKTVAEVMSERTGVPVADLGDSERDRLLHLEDALSRKVVGQPEAVREIANAVRMARSGLRDPGRPRGVFMFVGSSGVGKTELAKTLADTLFPEGDALIRMDMSEFSDKFTASRLVGAPPGYAGRGEEGQLSGPLRRRPYSVVLLDEFEKAHPDVQAMFLSLFDEGRLTDAEGREVHATEAFFILTTNAGTEFSGRSRLGFGGSDPGQRRSLAIERLRQSFRPELLNRLDDTIVFDPLEVDARRAIAELHLQGLAERAAERGVVLTWTSGVAALCAEHGADPAFGARPVVRAVEELVAEPLGSRMIANAGKRAVQAVVEDGTVVFREEGYSPPPAPDSSQNPSVPAALMQS